MSLYATWPVVVKSLIGDRESIRIMKLISGSDFLSKYCTRKQGFDKISNDVEPVGERKTWIPHETEITVQ